MTWWTDGQGNRGFFSDEGLVPVGWTKIRDPEEMPHPLDHDEDGRKGGDLPDSPPTLAGKNKAELREIAEAEGAEVADDATNAELREAIEANRAD